MTTTQTRPRSPALIALAAVWIAALYGSLQIHHFELGGHSICGAWGCGPTDTALIGYHTFWLVLILPVAPIAARIAPAARARNWGTVLAIAGVAGLVVLALVDGVHYLQTSHAPQYLVQRCLFRLATFVDIPLAQLILIGLLMRRLARPKILAEDSTDEASTL